MKKRILAVLLCCAVAAFGFTSCGSQTASSDTEETEATEEVGGDETVNPITEYDSLDELNADLGGRLYCPNDVAENQFYERIDAGDVAIAQYDYELDGTCYSVRFSSDLTTGISGMYTDDGEEEFSDPNAEDFTEFSVSEGSDYFLAHWLTVDGQYVFYADNVDMGADAFEEIARTYMDGTIPANS